MISPSLAAKIGFSGVGRVRLKPGTVQPIFEVPGKMDSKDHPSASAIFGKKKTRELLSKIAVSI